MKTISIQSLASMTRSPGNPNPKNLANDLENKNAIFW
jgi:hypothetical protein